MLKRRQIAASLAVRNQSAEAGRLTQQKPEMRLTTYQNVKAASNSRLFDGP